eukprot:s563_g18.t1
MAMALTARRATATVVPYVSQPPTPRGADALGVRRPHLEPFAKLPPVPVSETLVESRRKLWHLLGRAQAQRKYETSEDAAALEDGEDRIFGSKELSKTLVLAADLGSEKELQKDAWNNTLAEMFQLAKIGAFDNVALFMAAQSLYRLRNTEFSASCHPGSLRLFVLVLQTALGRTSTASMRHVANVTHWLARSADMVAGHPALQQQIGQLTMRAAEELLVRQHAGSAVSGREVGAICEAVRLLGLRNDLFLTYLRRLLRKDWEMIWTPKALIDALKCLVHFEQKDARAWKALAYRIESELPLLSPSALTEVCSAFAAASLRALEPKMARRLTEVASNLNAKDLSRLCSAVAALPDAFGGPELEAQLAEALVKAIPRRASDLSSRGLGAVCGALARWRAPSVPLLAALAKSVAAVEPREVEVMIHALLQLGGHEVLGSCPALLQGFLGSCRAAELPGGDLSSCVAVLQHVALARLQDVELCRAVTMAWMQRDLDADAPHSLLTGMRLVALCGAGATSFLPQLLMTLPEGPLMHPASGLPQDLVADAFAMALKSLALQRFRPPDGWRRAARKMLETGTLSAPTAFSLLMSLWALDELRSPKDVISICGGPSFHDLSGLSSAAKLSLCIGCAWRIPAMERLQRWNVWREELNLDGLDDVPAIDPADVAGFLRSPASTWPGILQLLEADCDLQSESLAPFRPDFRLETRWQPRRQEPLYVLVCPDGQRRRLFGRK